MKIAIITDTHYGARKGADYIHSYFKNFYDNIFFPYLENITLIPLFTWEICLIVVNQLIIKV